MGDRQADEEQSKLLNDAKARTKEQAFYMKRAMDNADLKAVLNHAADMLRELRTGLLSPRNYYELYMQVWTALPPRPDSPKADSPSALDLPLT